MKPMHPNDAPAITAAAGSPVSTLVLVCLGGFAWTYSTAVKWFGASTHLVAQASATVPGLSMTWADLGQAAGGLFSFAGIVIASVGAMRTRWARSENQRQLESARAKDTVRLESALTDVKIFLATELAKVQVHQAEVKLHLERQDAAIAEVKSAVSPAPPDVSSAPSPQSESTASQTVS